jgi:hypothetical protein
MKTSYPLEQVNPAECPQAVIYAARASAVKQRNQIFVMFSYPVSLHMARFILSSTVLANVNYHVLAFYP